MPRPPPFENGSIVRASHLVQDLWDDLLKETESLAKGDAPDPESGGGATAKAPPGEPAPGTGDQTRPILTWAGEKLHPEWMSAFIAGKYMWPAADDLAERFLTLVRGY